MKSLFKSLFHVPATFLTGVVVATSLCLTGCGGAGTSDSQSTDQLAGYQAKKITNTGTTYKEFRQAAEKVFEEYRTEITEAVHQEKWALAQRELMDYWELVDGLTPDQTGSIWDNERYQNAYGNFAAKILIEEARALMDKQDVAADEILLEQFFTIQPTSWSVRDKGQYSRSDGESVMDKASETIIQLAKLKGRTKILEYFEQEDIEE